MFNRLKKKEVKTAFFRTLDLEIQNHHDKKAMTKYPI